MNYRLSVSCKETLSTSKFWPRSYASRRLTPVSLSSGRVNSVSTWLVLGRLSKLWS